MQILTRETVEKTFAKHHWDDSKGWQKDLCGGLVRTVYQKENLSVHQYKHKDYQSVIFEMPKYIVYITGGTWKNIMQPNSKKEQPHFYSLSVSSSLSDRTLYRSVIDTVGYKDIHGDRDIVLDLFKKIPEQYFTLEKDEHAKYVSTYWMRIPRLFRREHRTHRLLKEIE